MNASAWLRRMRPNPDARLRMLCFPFAGGGAHAFRGWAERLPRIEVWAATLPGHVGRLNEPPPTDLIATARAVADAVRASPEIDGPLALFGHSMGAWLALEVARALEHDRPLRGLVVGGRNGPGFADDTPPLTHLPDAEFLAEVSTRWGGVSPEVAASDEIMELFLPMIRADIAMMERYDPLAGAQLRCPVLALGGATDPGVPAAGLAAWSTVTRGQFDTDRVHGGHFFIEQNRDEFLALTAAWLDRLV